MQYVRKLEVLAILDPNHWPLQINTQLSTISICLFQEVSDEGYIHLCNICCPGQPNLVIITMKEISYALLKTKSVTRGIDLHPEILLQTHGELITILYAGDYELAGSGDVTKQVISSVEHGPGGR